ncbi:MAG: serine/threonine protein kinase [Rhodanobacteraceae bacterium]|nr:serine/threonine protein kinase [Rhodanobacteraceae bacterium]
MEAPIQIPNFELFKEIGRGGMSRVYLARQLQPKREVAIKIVSPGSAPDEAFLSSLKIEGDTIAGLNHDNIVTVFACGVVDKHYYLAMEILPGGDLTERIKKGLRAEDAVEVMIQIGGALGHAHKKQVLHRDIKPENVMFHESGKAVLVDFGIAKEGDTESSFTQVGAVVGTPHYMSPERCMGKSTDARSDLYAMGVMFYEMLTGHKVFEGRDTFAVSYAHVYEPVPPLPPEHARFQGIVNKLLAKDPKDRYQTADEMVAALKKHRAGAPSSAEPATRRVDTTISSPLQEKLKRLAADDAGPGATTVNQPTGPVNLHAPTAVSAPLGAASGTASTTAVEAPKGKSVMLYGAILALVVVIGGGVVFWPKPKSDLPEVILNAQQQVEVQDKLGAARAMLRNENTEGAADLYYKVLKEFDCTNEEARGGLKGSDPTRYEEAISACK